MMYANVRIPYPLLWVELHPHEEPGQAVYASRKPARSGRHEPAVRPQHVYGASSYACSCVGVGRHGEQCCGHQVRRHVSGYLSRMGFCLLLSDRCTR